MNLAILPSQLHHMAKIMTKKEKADVSIAQDALNSYVEHIRSTADNILNINSEEPATGNYVIPFVAKINEKITLGWEVYNHNDRIEHLLTTFELITELKPFISDLEYRGLITMMNKLAYLSDRAPACYLKIEPEEDIFQPEY